MRASIPPPSVTTRPRGTNPILHFRDTATATLGVSLPELMMAMALLAIVAAIALPPFHLLDRLALWRSADLARSHLVRTRLEALAQREMLEVRLVRGDRLVTRDRSGLTLSSVDLRAGGVLRLDSIRIRPAVIRYNARGQGSPGSLYLYRGRRGVRVVSNFVGRVRRKGFQY